VYPNTPSEQQSDGATTENCVKKRQSESAPSKLSHKSARTHKESEEESSDEYEEKDSDQEEGASTEVVVFNVNLKQNTGRNITSSSSSSNNIIQSEASSISKTSLRPRRH